MSQTSLILICDDDPVVHESLGIYLKSDNFQVCSAYNGREGLDLFNSKHPDLIILDLMMPELSGIEVCREIRKTSKVPIIMLTAKGEEIDRILGLELGSDDYIVKPFSPREVLARVKAVLRRSQDNESATSPSVLRFQGLEINISNYQVLVDGENVPFTPKEVEILYLLASNPGIVMDREKILAKVWGYDYYGDTRTVDTHIKRIRQKIDCESHVYKLVTVYGVGYKFEAGQTD